MQSWDTEKEPGKIQEDTSSLTTVLLAFSAPCRMPCLSLRAPSPLQDSSWCLFVKKKSWITERNAPHWMEANRPFVQGCHLKPKTTHCLVLDRFLFSSFVIRVNRSFSLCCYVQRLVQRIPSCVHKCQAQDLKPSRCSINRCWNFSSLPARAISLWSLWCVGEISLWQRVPGTPPVECGKLMWFPLTSQVLLFNQYELCIMDLCIERLRSLIYVHVDRLSLGECLRNW